jgi:predicted dehydrogenase
VCVPNDRCPEVLHAAVAAGTPTLFEKPGATSAAALQAVAAAARQAGVPTGAIYPWRWHPIARQVRQAVQAGMLGSPFAVEARMVTSQVRYRDPAHWLFRRAWAGGGILSWLGCHWLDLLCYLLDDRVARVGAITAHQNPEPIEVEDSACLSLRFGSGTLGSLQAGYHLPYSRSGYQGAAYDTYLTYLAIRGADGYATWAPSVGDAYTLLSAAGRQETRFELPAVEAYGGAYGAAFVRDFLQAARAGQPAPCPIEAAVHVLEIIEAASAASEQERLVSLASA